MGKGFKHGTSNPLNFKVVAYATKDDLDADTPRENTIGVVTTEPITGWYFTIEQPENMADGEVWFGTGTISTVGFNAIKKNNLMVYPMMAKQMISGELVDVVSKSFQNGGWVEWWNGGIWIVGKDYTNITGGWIGDPDITIDGRSFKTAGTESESGLTVSISTNDKSSNIVTKKAIPLTGYAYVQFTVGSISISTGTAYAFLCREDSSDIVASLGFKSADTANALTIEIPAEGGNFRVGFYISTSSGTRSFTVTDVRAIK